MLRISVLLLPLLLSCTLKPPRAPPSEAEKVVFTEETPDTTVKLDGVRLRAVNLALRDFLPEPGSAAKCEDRQHSYDLVVWLAEDPLHGTPGLVYVELYLRPGACEGVPDRSAIYAIDVEQWRIAATRP